MPFIHDLKSQWNALRLIAVGTMLEGRSITPSQNQLIAIADEAFTAARVSHRQREKAAFAIDPEGYNDRLGRAERAQLDNIRAIEFQEFDQWVEPAARLLKNRGFSADRTSDWFRRFVEMLAEVTVSSIDVFLRGARGEFNAESTSQVVSKARQITADALVSSGDIPFLELSEAFNLFNPLANWRDPVGEDPIPVGPFVDEVSKFCGGNDLLRTACCACKAAMSVSADVGNRAPSCPG